MAMDLESKQIQTLTDGQRDESPSFSPNGRIILYASDVDNRGVLAAVSSDAASSSGSASRRPMCASRPGGRFWAMNKAATGRSLRRDSGEHEG